METLYGIGGVDQTSDIVCEPEHLRLEGTPERVHYLIMMDEGRRYSG
jgi:hypothetical protein